MAIPVMMGDAPPPCAVSEGCPWAHAVSVRPHAGAEGCPWDHVVSEGCPWAHAVSERPPCGRCGMPMRALWRTCKLQPHSRDVGPARRSPMSNLLFRKESDMEDSEGGGGCRAGRRSTETTLQSSTTNGRIRGGCLGGVKDLTELTHLGVNLAIPWRMGDCPPCAVSEGCPWAHAGAVRPHAGAVGCPCGRCATPCGRCGGCP